MFSPYRTAVLKFTQQAIGDHALFSAAERVAAAVITEADLQQVVTLLNQFYQAGYKKAVEDIKKQLGQG